jgi:hypothetical protein
VKAESGRQGRESGRLGDRAAWLAWGAWTLSVTLGLLAVLFYLLSSSIPLEDRDRPPLAFLPVAVLAVLSFATVGALVASRRPKNPIGWILSVVGLGMGFGFFAQGYADYVLIVRPGSLPGGGIAVWSLSWSGNVLTVAPTFLLLLFPDGRLPSSRWRAVAWLAAVAAVASLGGAAFSPGVPDDDYPMVTNPVGIGGTFGDLLNLMNSCGGALLAAALFLSVISITVRLRRSRGEKRQQIKWIVYAGAVMFAAFLAAWVVPDGTGRVADLLWALGFVALVGIPVAAGIAVLKYRLYDIDVIINRTLVYGSLTVSLALVYLGGVVSLQYAFRTLTGQESQLAVVASTLSIAALFVPLRLRVQLFVDRRFYRKKYDARKTLEAFSAKLREETDLEALGGELVGVVRETMQPAHVSLWLRPQTASEAKRAD